VSLEDTIEQFAFDRMSAIADEFVATCRTFAPRRTGALAESIEVDSVTRGTGGVTARIVVGAPYASFQNYGTGIYGPNGSPIYPRSGKVLVFDSAILGGLVFVRWVRGTEPTHFWERTLEQWSDIIARAS
jgi:hypothetical protein